MSIVEASDESKVVDAYRQHFGVRDVKVTETQVLINNRPFYCHGAAKHEDSDVRRIFLYMSIIWMTM